MVSAVTLLTKVSLVVFGYPVTNVPGVVESCAPLAVALTYFLLGVTDVLKVALVLNAFAVVCVPKPVIAAAVPVPPTAVPLAVAPIYFVVCVTFTVGCVTLKVVSAPNTASLLFPVNVTAELDVSKVVPVPKTGEDVVEIVSNVAKPPRVDRSPNSHH